MKTKILSFIILSFGIVYSAVIINSALAQSNTNATIIFKKDANNLFIITIKDPQGIKEFSFNPENKSSYGGTLSGCPTTRTIDNVVFEDPADFTPHLKGYVTDCDGNRADFQIPALKNNFATGVRIKSEEEKKQEEEAAAKKAVQPTVSQPKTVTQPTEKITSSTVVPEIKYPIAELGNCKNETACRNYCDKSENMKVCVSFAEKNNLIPKEEIEHAKKFLAMGGTGPAGCKNKDSCETYCNELSHMDECISFGEKNGLMSSKDLEEAKKVQAAIKRGVKPPPCNGKKECDVYCDSPDHMEECINFGVEAGFIQGKELEDSQKMLAALKRGVKPPPCKGKEACDEYCQNPDNMERCMNFAIEAGIMDEKQKGDSQKMLQAIKKGVKPPNCKGKKECDAFCQSEEHMEECINFSVAAGMMTEKDAEMAKKTKGKGPGGCKGKEECDAFCKDNQEECFKFGVENGMIPPEELQRMEKDKQNFKQTFSNLPAEVEMCLKESVGSEQVEKFKTGEIMPPREIGDKMRDCFEKTVKPMGPPCEGENCPPLGEGGNFQPGPGAVNQGGQMMPQQAGPGGCKGTEECAAFCGQNPDQCKNFQSGSMAPETTRGGPNNQVCEDPSKCGNFQPRFESGQGGFINSEDMRNRVQQNPMESIREFRDNMDQQLMDRQNQQGAENRGQMPPGTQTGPPSGQYGPPQFIPPTGPGAGGGSAPGEIGPGPGTAPPGDIITPPADGGGAPPPPPSSSIIKRLFFASVDIMADLFR